jgi:alpha-tubulin suppressor-like RCC1 family protein
MVLLMKLTGRAPRSAARSSLPVAPRLGAVAAIAAIAAIAGLTAGFWPARAQTTKRRQVTSEVEHWGSFFGGRKGNFGTEMSPVAIPLPGIVAQVGSSNSTEYALLTNGRLYAWGLGGQGQLGDGRDHNSFTRPVRVRFPAGVRIASIPTDVMPYDTGLAVDTRGRVWGWGHNGGGQLCLGNRTPEFTPVRLPLRDVTALAGASNHAVYDARGTVYACGQNVEGDLGDGTRRNTTRPVRVPGLNGSLVTTLVASFANSGALLSNGDYYDWGYNAQGQLGSGKAGKGSDVPVHVKLSQPVVQVAQGGSLWGNGCTLVLLSDGTLRAWGDNWAGQLGNGKRGTRSSPTVIHPPAGVSYQSLATGSATSYAMSPKGKVYAWGASHVGQVGNGSDHTVLKPVLILTGATMISSTANNVVVGVPREICTRRCGRR